MEVHDDVDNALSDASTQWPIDKLEKILTSIIAFRETYLIEHKKIIFIKNYFQIAIPLLIIITTLNTKILSLTSSFSFDLIILSLVFLIPNNRKNFNL